MSRCNGCTVEGLLKRYGNDGRLREVAKNDFKALVKKRWVFKGWYMSVEHCDDDDCKHVRKGVKPPNVRKQLTEKLGTPWYLRDQEGDEDETG